MRLISRKTLLLFFLPGAIFMGAFLIYPIITMVVDSFFEIGITGDKTFVGLENYIRAFTAGGFLKQLKNTLLYIVIAVSIETAIGLLFALFFELNYKGSKIIRSLMMALYWSSFLVTLCSEIMLYIETPLVSYSYSLNEVSHSCTS